jgi:hypothetical protein
MKVLCPAMLIAAFAIGAASAQTATTLTTPTSGYHYFNRPGATIEEHLADLTTCRDALDGVPPGAQGLMANAGAAVGNYAGYVYTPSTEALSGAAAGVVGVGYLAAGVDAMIDARRMRHANFENCMVVRGWRVARLDDATGRELDSLPQAELATRLASLVGVDIPGDQIIRRFGNEAPRERVTLFAAPEAFDEVSLSVQSLADRPEPTEEERAALRAAQREARNTAREEARARRRDPALRAQHEALMAAVTPVQIQPRAIASLPQDATVIVVHFGGPMGGALMPSITFVRVPDPNAQTAEDSAASAFAASPPARLIAPAGQRLMERTFVFTVPPGRWRLQGMMEGQYSASFCLGSPSFEVARGDVVYAGAFYTSEHDRGPDLSMERAQAALANAPALAQRLRPAEYRNGEVFQCMGSYFYAYEVPGAPFRESYTHGSNHGIAAPMMGQASGAADSQQTSAESTVQAPAP